MPVNLAIYCLARSRRQDPAPIQAGEVSCSARPWRGLIAHSRVRNALGILGRQKARSDPDGPLTPASLPALDRWVCLVEPALTFESKLLRRPERRHCECDAIVS